MNYYIDAEKTTLDDLKKRITETDLVPSRSLLLENIQDIFKKLKDLGYKTLADLRSDLRNSKNISLVSKKTKIDSEYLTLLRREIESYFPKAFPVSSFDWLPKQVIAKLEMLNYKNTVLLFECMKLPDKKEKLIKDTGIDSHIINELSSLVNLTRIQWISPMAARMLIAAGYADSKSVLKADAEKMCNELDKVNRENNYFKGKIGLRDVKRLIKAASYVS